MFIIFNKNYKNKRKNLQLRTPFCANVVRPGELLRKETNASGVHILELCARI